MILSNENLFSDNQAVTATAISTNQIDLGVKGTPVGAVSALLGDPAPGNPVELAILVTQTFTKLTSLKVAVETGASATLGTEVASITVPLANLKAGYQVPLRFLPEGITGRYVGLRYTVTGTAPDAGKILAGITLGQQSNRVGV